jgi:predicted Rossmann fold flavoprotein
MTQTPQKNKTAPRAVLIIGGGASGMMAAIAAARHGARVLVAERLKRIGKKLLATGNGRCNLSNILAGPDSYQGGDASFVQAVFDQFSAEDTLTFFREIGLELRTETDGKIFPRCNQASAVLDLLRREMARLGVEELCGCKIQEIRREGNTLICRGMDDAVIHADAVILAAGGQSAPNLGSNGGGYRIAEKLGHGVTPLFPALVQVECEGGFFKRLKGLKIDARVTARAEGAPLKTAEGEVLFADYGLSGPPILELSRIVSARSLEEKTTTLALDIFPDWDAADLAENIRQRISRLPDETLESALIGLLHKRLIPVILREAGVDETCMACADVPEPMPAQIAALCRDWPINAVRGKTWMGSQVTAGGIALKEIAPHTLASRLMPGVFFCGEVLDVDGGCGGYNLQWAWSSGYVAGLHAAGGATPGS